jgi:hypothetical protein
MAPKIFADTNIIIDFIEQRPYQITYTNPIFIAAENNLIEMYVSESVLINIWYITSLTKQIIRLLPLIQLIPGNVKTIRKAFESSFSDKEDAVSDKEDAVLYYSALDHGMNYFLTHNEKHFKKHVHSDLPVVSPQKLVTLLKL